jgi:DNA-binding MarR family transcriptional regulator
MTEGGWIIKKQDPDDLRISRIFPSEKANQLKDPLIKERQKANIHLLKKFTIEEQVLFKRLLRDLI